MRLLYVLRYFPTLTETFVYREIEELVRRGVHVRAIAMGSRADGGLQDELPPIEVVHVPRGVKSSRLIAPFMRSLGRPALRWAMRTMRPKDAARALWLGERVREWRIDRIHAHFAGEAAEAAFVASAMTGIPFGVTVHAADLFKPRPSLPEVLRAANPVIVVADHHRAWLRAKFNVESTVLRLGVDPNRYVAAHPEVVDGPLRVVAVGRWVPKKGLDLLVRAVESLATPVHLRLVSDAPTSLASPRVEIGAVPPSQIPTELANAHVFALPCRVAPDGDRDGLPVAILEAMAAGLPIISTSVAGIPEIVDSEVGWLIPPDNEEALSRALFDAASNPVERARKGAAARRRIVDGGWTIARQGDELLRLLGS